MPSRSSSKNTISLELKSLNRLSSAISSDLSLDRVLDITVKEIRRIFGIKICGIFLPDEGGILKMIKYSGVKKSFQTYFNRNINPQINRNIFKILKPRYTNDVLTFYKDNKFLHAVVKIGKFRKEMSVPLKLKREIIGVLNVGRYAKERDFTAQDLALVTIFANHVAIAINNVKLYKKLVDYTHTLEEQNKDLNTILKVSQTISRFLELDKILRVATQKMAQALKVGRSAVTLGTPAEGIGVVKAVYLKSKKETAPPIIGTKFYLKDYPFLQKAIKEKTYAYMPDIMSSSIPSFLKEYYRKTKTKSMLFVPFIIGKQIIGCFTVNSLEKRRTFSPREIKLAQTIANQVTVAIENARLMDLVKEHSHHLSLLSAEVIRAQEEERKRIAEQLHDQVGQALTAMKINLEMSSRSLPQKLKSVKDRLTDTQELLTQTLEEIRYLTFDLRPTMLDDFGLIPTLRWYGKSFSKRFKVEFNLKTDNFKRLSSEIETLMYRLAQEALINVAKHSQAKKVWINLSYDNSNAYMSIRDNGIGFDADKLYRREFSKNNFGLMSMKERVKHLNGNISIKSKIDSGTRLKVKIPVIRDEKDKSAYSR